MLELIEDLIKPFARTTSLLCTIPGIKQITAMGLVCELGDDLSKFTSVKHFCSWLGICPGNSESAGKRYSGKCAKGNKYLRTLLIEAAQGVASHHVDQYRAVACVTSGWRNIIFMGIAARRE